VDPAETNDVGQLFRLKRTQVAGDLQKEAIDAWQPKYVKKLVGVICRDESYGWWLKSG